MCSSSTNQPPSLQRWHTTSAPSSQLLARFSLSFSDPLSYASSLRVSCSQSSPSVTLRVRLMMHPTHEPDPSSYSSRCRRCRRLTIYKMCSSLAAKCRARSVHFICVQAHHASVRVLFNDSLNCCECMHLFSNLIEAMKHVDAVFSYNYQHHRLQWPAP